MKRSMACLLGRQSQLMTKPSHFKMVSPMIQQPLMPFSSMPFKVKINQNHIKNDMDALQATLPPAPLTSVNGQDVV